MTRRSARNSEGLRRAGQGRQLWRGKARSGDRFHQGAVSRSVRYGSHVKMPNIPHPDADNHAAKIVTGWRLGQRLAIRGGEGNVHGDNLMKSALKQTETFGISGKKGRKLLR